jgi:DNA-binding winged helix-turn-helix (wHTH) protein
MLAGGWKEVIDGPLLGRLPGHSDKPIWLRGIIQEPIPGADPAAPVYERYRIDWRRVKRKYAVGYYRWMGLDSSAIIAKLKDDTEICREIDQSFDEGREGPAIGEAPTIPQADDPPPAEEAPTIPQADDPPPAEEVPTIPPADDPPPRSGYLGLVFDDSRREVGRDGFQDRVPFGGRTLAWKILQKLEAMKGAFVSKDDLLRVWDACDRDTAEDNRMYKEVSDLRGMIRKIGVGIQNTPGVGWGLVEIKKDSAQTEHRSKGRRK